MRRAIARWVLGTCPGGLKMLEETLCIAQARIGNSPLDRHRQERDIARLQYLIGLVRR